MARFPAWLAALSLLSLGSIAAHSLAYRIVEPGEQTRAELLAGTGHGYLSAVPFFAAACLALALAALIGIAARAWRGALSSPPGWPLALVPPLGFALQEHLERLLSGSDWSIAAALEPTFLVGLALQVPFGLLALALARHLARAAHELGCSLARPTVVPTRAAPRLPAPLETRLVPAGALALGYAVRGPPS